LVFTHQGTQGPRPPISAHPPQHQRGTTPQPRGHRVIYQTLTKLSRPGRPGPRLDLHRRRPVRVLPHPRLDLGVVLPDRLVPHRVGHGRGPAGRPDQPTAGRPGGPRQRLRHRL